jgi:hypothetical protein
VILREIRLTRRRALRAGALGAAGLAFGGLAVGAAQADVTQDAPLPVGTLGLDEGWLFGPYVTGAEQPGYDEVGLPAVVERVDSIELGIDLDLPPAHLQCGARGGP